MENKVDSYTYEEFEKELELCKIILVTDELDVVPGLWCQDCKKENCPNRKFNK